MVDYVLLQFRGCFHACFFSLSITVLPALLMSHNILIGHPGLTGDWSGDQAMKIHSYP